MQEVLKSGDRLRTSLTRSETVVRMEGTQILIQSHPFHTDHLSGFDPGRIRSSAFTFGVEPRMIWIKIRVITLLAKWVQPTLSGLRAC